MIQISKISITEWERTFMEKMQGERNAVQGFSCGDDICQPESRKFFHEAKCLFRKKNYSSGYIDLGINPNNIPITGGGLKVL